MPRLVINEVSCSACNRCGEACPMGILIVEKEKVKANQVNMCMVCRLCEVECPKEAIKVFDD